MLILFAVCLIGLSVLTLVLALAVRFAGQSKPLSLVDYSRVDDPHGLHRAVGNRLFLMPLLTAGIASAAFLDLQTFMVVAAAGVVLLIVVMLWVLQTALRFQSTTNRGAGDAIG